MPPCPLYWIDCNLRFSKRIRAELERVRGFVDRAESISGDSKAEKLLEVVRFIRKLGEQGKGSGKVLIFTESLTTQSYLENLLTADGLRPEEITDRKSVV